jgi:hypothetical protein
MKRPLALSILMWFAGLYACGAIIGISIALAGIGRYSIGGTPVTREQWLSVAAPLVAAIALLMGLSAFGLWHHRKWARPVFMSIWPLIAIYGLGAGFVHSVSWSLALRAVIDATIFGLIFGWLLYRHRPSVEYFRSIQTR